MEALAKYDFDGQQADEISFRKGNRLCIINTDDPDWLEAVNGSSLGVVPRNYVQMEQTSWFQPQLKKAQAQELLLERNSYGKFIYPDGVFIVRKSETDKLTFSLTVKFENATMNFKIMRNPENKFHVWPEANFYSINQLIKAYHNTNLSREPHKVIKLRDIPDRVHEAVYDFQPTSNGEIPLSRGDPIIVTDSSEMDWWEGEVNGQQGLFPMTYVKEYRRKHRPLKS